MQKGREAKRCLRFGEKQEISLLFCSIYVIGMRMRQRQVSVLQFMDPIRESAACRTQFRNST
jgi:hypothetical protein